MLGLRARDFAVWIAYCAMLVVIVPWHEPWRDEAQAWLLARDLSIPQLLFHNLRYESHPILWYLVLWVPAHLHLSYAALGWIAAVIAAAGIYVLLRLSPFPFYLRALLPFTFFLAYQYAIVGRSYVLFPLLCFLIAHIYRQQRPRPILMAVLLGLLANVSVHGTLVACSVAAVYSWYLFRRGRTVEISNRTLASAALLFVASIALVAIAVRPPADLYTVTTAPAVSNALHLQLPHSQATGAVSKGISLSARLADLPETFSYSLSTSHIFSFVLYLLVAVYLYMRGQVLLLAPLAVLGAFLDFVYALQWHLGLMWVVLIMVVWAAWDSEADRGPLTLQNALAVLLAVFCALQLPWTFRADQYDRQSQYYPSKQAAAYLHTLPEGLRIAGFWDSTTILPYFDTNIFFNQPTAFEWNSTRNTVTADAAQTIATHPNLIVVLTQRISVIEIAQVSGYRETHRFCGKMFLPNVPSQLTCYVVLEPGSSPASSN